MTIYAAPYNKPSELKINSLYKRRKTASCSSLERSQLRAVDTEVRLRINNSTIIVAPKYPYKLSDSGHKKEVWLAISRCCTLDLRPTTGNALQRNGRGPFLSAKVHAYSGRFVRENQVSVNLDAIAPLTVLSAVGIERGQLEDLTCQGSWCLGWDRPIGSRIFIMCIENWVRHCLSWVSSHSDRWLNYWFAVMQPCNWLGLLWQVPEWDCCVCDLHAVWDWWSDHRSCGYWTNSSNTMI